MGQDTERLGVVELEEVIFKLPLKRVAGTKRASLTLTSLRVFMTKSEGIFGELDISIPLSAVDSFHFGWERKKPLLIAGCLGVLLGGLGAAGYGVKPDACYWILVIGVVSLLVFFFYRPTVLIVRSGIESAGGEPGSHKDAKEFMKALTQQMERLNLKS